MSGLKSGQPPRGLSSNASSNAVGRPRTAAHRANRSGAARPITRTDSDGLNRGRARLLIRGSCASMSTRCTHMHPKTPRAPPFAQVTVETISALRSRERRFESCWGRSNAASEVIPLNCRNGNRAAVDAPPLCVTGGRLAPVFSPRGPRKIGPGSARTSLSLLPNASSLVGFACCSRCGALWAILRCAARLAVRRPQRGVHPCDPHVLPAGHAAGVDAHQHLDAVPGPRGDLGGRDAGVQPPGDPRVAQVMVKPISA